MNYIYIYAWLTNQTAMQSVHTRWENFFFKLQLYGLMLKETHQAAINTIQSQLHSEKLSLKKNVSLIQTVFQISDSL